MTLFTESDVLELIERVPQDAWAEACCTTLMGHIHFVTTTRNGVCIVAMRQSEAEIFLVRVVALGPEETPAGVIALGSGAEGGNILVEKEKHADLYERLRLAQQDAQFRAEQRRLGNLHGHLSTFLGPAIPPPRPSRLRRVLRRLRWRK